MEKFDEVVKLSQEVRDYFERMEKGAVSKSEFEEFREKIENELIELKSLQKRPPKGAEAAEDVEIKAAFLKALRGAPVPPELKQLVEDAAGQILVPEAVEKEIITAIPAVSVVRPLASVTTTTSNRVRVRSLTDVVVGWGKLETGGTIPQGGFSPAEEYIYVEDLYGLIRVGEDLLADTDVALEALIVDSFSRKIAEAEDAAFIAGGGHSVQQPSGILTGNVVTRVNAGQPGGITAEDLLKLVYNVPEQYRKNGVFIVNSSTELAIWLLKDEQGRWVWQPSLAQGRPGTVLGYPIFNHASVPGIPAAGTAKDVAIFGDIKAGYRIVDRAGITVQRLSELYAEDGLVGFKAHFRVGGGVVRPDALRILRVPAS